MGISLCYYYKVKGVVRNPTSSGQSCRGGGHEHVI